MLACVAQIIAGNKAKEGGRPHELRGEPQDKESPAKAQLRRQLASANKQLSQRRQNNEKLNNARDQDGPCRGGNRRFRRQDGGYNRDDRRGSLTTATGSVAVAPSATTQLEV